MESRAFRNPYPDYEGLASIQRLFDSAGNLTSDFIQQLQSKISELLQHMENGLIKGDETDCTSYTGWAGIALLYLHLHNIYGDQSFLQKALQYVNKSLKCLTGRVVTFLCGDAGPLAVAAVVHHKLRQTQESDAYINQLLQLHQSVVKLNSRLPDEMLYGRIGYLYALLFVNDQFGTEKISMQYMKQVCDAVISSGEKLSSRKRISKSPLMYEWYQEYYVGAAHGLAGIYYFLMQPELGVDQDTLVKLVKPSVDYVCQLKFSSGNYPPCIGESRDNLVHWCHGSPGVIYMLIQAYKIFKEERYLQDASDCAEVIWHRGLLKKGYGLCHGPAGNAYGFLAMYNLTGDKKYLYRACKFAEWCFDYGKHGCRTPDSPFSLFEGMAGTIYFLADLLQPTKAKFPAFEV
ncbi:glutathione S-transferase LANCL1 [Rhincodon typus]|uniref:glutathione S-transferase LANCL1 n=1 Tax=Rhincodon typus TaxID=259920 RepID=UPI0020309A7C|nr:glutathione S-transferase LANCL1 [Rhincodon typus]